MVLDGVDSDATKANDGRPGGARYAGSSDGEMATDVIAAVVIVVVARAWGFVVGKRAIISSRLATAALAPRVRRSLMPIRGGRGRDKTYRPDGIIFEGYRPGDGRRGGHGTRA
jgi:hypothetical protein